jgi:hypothetical protein
MSDDQCQCFHLLSLVCFLTSLTVLEGTWARLAQVAVKGAQYNSPERQPHPKCLDGTRVDLLKYIHELLDDPKKNQLIWLHGTAGVGKSAVAFTVAEKMRGLKVTEETNVEKRLAGTFFFSRKHTNRCTAGYFFATLAYQLATNFPSIRQDVNRAIRNNPALLDPNTPLCDQMEALFLQPLRKLHLRLRGCQPLSFVVDALDECTSEPELTDLILSLARALRESDLPVTHILLASRSESHICKAFRNEEVRPLVCEIPVKTSGEGVATTISLDGVDVDNDIYIFLQHSFGELQYRHPDFPQPSGGDLAKLASRAGRRFIVASTMMKFIVDDGCKDPRDRLQLMLELTSGLLAGTEVYKLYDCILSTCADPKRAYLHLSVVAALADPLPLSQISKLLGPGQGCDTETTLVQLRSVIDIPTDTSLPINIYHSSVRDYVSDPSNCSLLQVREHDMPSPHALLADSSLRLMKAIPKSTALLDALSELKKQCNAMRPEDPYRLKDSLAFLVRPPEPLSSVICMLWLRGDRTSDLQSWLGTVDGSAWLRTWEGQQWPQTWEEQDWLQTQAGQDWLQTQGGQKWLWTRGGQQWLQTWKGRAWLQTQAGQEWLQTGRGRDWQRTLAGKAWLAIPAGREQGWWQIPAGRGWRLIPAERASRQTRERREWLQTREGRKWLQTQEGRKWLQTQEGRDWLQTQAGRGWLQTQAEQELLQTREGRELLRTQAGQELWWIPAGRDRLQIPAEQDWLQIPTERDWLQTQAGREWLQTQAGQKWLQTEAGREWLQIQAGREWLQIRAGREWLGTQAGREWLQVQAGRGWLQTQAGREWLQAHAGRDWLLTQAGREWLLAQAGRDRLQTQEGREWLQSRAGQEWLQTQEVRDWLQTQEGRDWLQTHGGRDWLQTQGGRHWLQTQGGRHWLQTQKGQDWLQTQAGRDWLQTQEGRNWLQTQAGRDWLQTQAGRDWLQTPHGQAWQSTPAASVWVTMEEFLRTSEAIEEYIIISNVPSLPAFQIIRLFKTLPDFLMFPVFLALRHQHHSTSALPTRLLPDREIIFEVHSSVSFW